jgi:membrane protein insertase Oxa1/YidC/SpoIIIJ
MILGFTLFTKFKRVTMLASVILLLLLLATFLGRKYKDVPFIRYLQKRRGLIGIIISLALLLYFLFSAPGLPFFWILSLILLVLSAYYIFKDHKKEHR